MKKTLLISAFTLAFTMALTLIYYCRTTKPATTPLPENYRPAKNVAVGNGSAQSCYPTADFVLKFEDAKGLGLVTVSLDGEVCHYPAEVYAESTSSWAGVWGENYVRIGADGTTEGSIEGRTFTYARDEK